MENKLILTQRTWAATIGFTKITPAEAGILAEAIDTAVAAGKGDDEIVDHVAAILMSEAAMDEKTASDVAYDAWHSGWRKV
jgi:hypothetical protein